jgi:putative FmdB family regulatory protein
MPIYEYECSECGAENICLILNRTDDPNPPCPLCGSKTGLEKIISAPMAGRRVINFKEPGGFFTSEKQVEARYGKNWRQTAKNPYRPGGDRQKDYYTSRSKRS